VGTPPKDKDLTPNLMRHLNERFSGRVVCSSGGNPGPDSAGPLRRKSSVSFTSPLPLSAPLFGSRASTAGLPARASKPPSLCDSGCSSPLPPTFSPAASFSDLSGLPPSLFDDPNLCHYLMRSDKPRLPRAQRSAAIVTPALRRGSCGQALLPTSSHLSPKPSSFLSPSLSQQQICASPNSKPGGHMRPAPTKAPLTHSRSMGKMGARAGSHEVLSELLAP